MELVSIFMGLYGPVSERLSPTSQRAGAAKLLSDTEDIQGLRMDSADAHGVRGVWFRTAAERNHAVMYFLHGGGYVMGSPATHRGMVGRICDAAGCRAFVPDYRLAPEHPAPAQLEDAVTGYRWLLQQGVHQNHIAIVGDSAGGGLTVATLVRLRELGLPLPAAGAVVSPWVDLEFEGASITLNAPYDYVTRSHLEVCRKWLIGDANPRNPIVSPLHADLRGLPALMIQVGGAEALLDDSLRLAARARDAGVEVDLDVHPDMPHVWHIFASFLPEARRALAMLGEFVERRTTGRSKLGQLGDAAQ